ncbi:MFS transporter [Paenibacillus sp. CAA11]|uniref:MDR family MFS transporter n=1 Tax=Paenibacillus sp. CAA11 TaxID=1532905 RepID=UPI000D342EDA|nr:MDR family MFS transporter [Paenibacillus sp. CAA11]AWB46524.1 MFS transporter [Paenibacillus sp. CAA11]
MSTEKSKAGLVTIGLLIGLFLSSLDQTIVSTAMPTVIKDLGGFSLYSWVFTIYMLASTTTVPIYGKLADLFGRRKMYLIGLILFVVGSVLCGFSENITQLIIFRGIQGLGAGALMPISMTIVADIYPPDQRGKFMGLFGAVYALSSIFGPALGGMIVEHWDWGWIFFINLPIGIVALLVVAAGLKETRSNEKQSIDWLGVLTLSAGVVAVLLALVLGGEGQGDGTRYAWTSPQILGLFAAGAVLLALFTWIESKVKEPIITLSLFRIRAIAFGNIVGFLMSAAMFGAIVYIPLFVQGVIGVNSSVSGYILTPLMLSFIVTSIIGGRLMSKLSYRTILIASLALMMVGFTLLSQISEDTTQSEMILYMIIAGLGMGAVYPTVGTAAQNAVDSKLRGVATSSSQFFRSMGGTIGVSVFGSLMAQQMSSEISKLNQKLNGALPADQLKQLVNPQVLLDSNARHALPEQVLAGLRAAFSHSLSSVFLGALIFVGVGLVASALMGNARLVESKEYIEAAKIKNEL